MDATKSHIKVYNFTQADAEDFEFDFSFDSNDLLTELVPNLDQWGDIGWMELEEYEYHAQGQVLYLTLETKWAPPTRWLQQASCDNVYFQNKLITMTTIQKDETAVNGVAIMDGELLQEKVIFEMDAEKVSDYYNDEKSEYDLDDLDNQIWDSIGQFTNVCEQFYLERKEND
mgnify:CR=1 FL=1|tara:strand:- start:3706 stop:4221 length:516 start_codon:yes stop_codon:yes gene_type:complete